MSENQANAYAPPAVQTEMRELPASQSSAWEAERRAALNIESQVKAAGMLAYMAVVGYVGLLVAQGIRAIVVHEPGALDPLDVLTTLIACALTGVAGYQLRRIRKLGRTLYAVHFIFNVLTMVLTSAMAASNGVNVKMPGFVQFLIPLAIGGYLFGPKGNVVFADIYQQYVLPSTPHIKAKTAWWGWLLPGIFVVAIALGLIAGLVSRFF